MLLLIGASTFRVQALQFEAESFAQCESKSFGVFSEKTVNHQVRSNLAAKASTSRLTWSFVLLTKDSKKRLLAYLLKLKERMRPNAYLQ
jgi:hypothetical protein